MKEFVGRSVFLTGHTGFKGSWLALWLHRLGAKVHGFSLEPTEFSLFRDAGVSEVLASHTVGDVRDCASVLNSLRNAEAEIVFHLAAQPLVRASYRDPRQTFETNVLGTVNVLEAVRQVSSVKVCQIVTSDKCYENRESQQAYRESDPFGGYDPYSASKGCAEIVVAAYRRSFFDVSQFEHHRMSLSSVRAGNIIGGGDWSEDRLVPDCIRFLERKESVIVRNPDAVRPWQFVLDPLWAYLSLAARQWTEGARFSDSFNVAPHPHSVVTVGSLVNLILKEWGSGQWHQPSRSGTAKGNPHEARHLALDIEKAVTKLGWTPTYELDRAVAETVRWYRDRFRGGKSFSGRELCSRQIGDFERTALEKQSLVARP
jgi:CDP-glucose 4,6-dehydratase